MKEISELSFDVKLQGVENEVLGVKPVQVPLVQQRSHMDWSGMQPGAFSEKPATIQNSHGHRKEKY